MYNKRKGQLMILTIILIILSPLIIQFVLWVIIMIGLILDGKDMEDYKRRDIEQEHH